MQQKQIFGFRKSKLTKNLTGAVLGAALLASVGVAQADTPTEGRQPDRITEKTKTVMKIDDWANVSTPEGSKYDRVDMTPRATSTIQIGTSGTDPLPKNSYIKVIQEATGVQPNLLDTSVSINDKGVTSEVSPTETGEYRSKSVVTVDISGMPAGEIKTFTAAFQGMAGFYPASTLTRTYELWVDGKKVDTQTFDTHFSSVKPKITVEASDSDTFYFQGKLEGTIGKDTVGSHELSISTNISRPVTLKIQAPEGSVPIGYRMRRGLGMPEYFQPFKDGENGVTFKDGILTIPNYQSGITRIPIFSPSAETLKNPIPTTGDNLIGSKKVQFHATMIVPEDIQGTTTATAEAAAEATERTTNRKPVAGELAIQDDTSPFGSEKLPTNVRRFTELEHEADQRLSAYDNSTTMDIHPVLLRLDETNTLDTKNVGMKFNMYADRVKAPIHFEVRDNDTNKVLIADYVLDPAGKSSTVDIPYTKNLLITPKANADGTLPQFYGDETKGPQSIHYSTTITGLDPNTYRARVDANAGVPVRIENVSHLRDTKDPTKVLLKSASDTYIAYSRVTIGSSSNSGVAYIGNGANPSTIYKLGDKPGVFTPVMTGWTMNPKVQLTIDPLSQFREDIKTLPENQQPRVHFDLPEGTHLVVEDPQRRYLLDGNSASIDQFMSGLSLVADKDLPEGTYEAPYTIDFSHVPNIEDYTFKGAEKGSSVLKGSLKLTLYAGDKISTTSEVQVGSTWRPYKLDVKTDAPFTIRSNVRIGKRVATQLNTLVYIPKKGRDNTTIDTFLTGPVQYDNSSDSQSTPWIVQYTTDPITGDRVADNKNLHFTNTVDDYSKVTAVRFIFYGPMPMLSGYGGTEGFALKQLGFPLVTHDEIKPTSVAYYRTSLVDSEHSYDSDFVALAGPNFVDHDKVLANSKGSVRQLFKEEGTNKELAPQTDTGMKPVGEALSLTHPKTIQFEGKTYEFTRQDKVDPTKIPDAFRETITYFYREVQPKGNVVQKFVDEAGKEIKASTDTGVKPVDEAIKLEHPTTIHFEDSDYSFVRQDKVDPTKIVEGTQIVTYIYKKVEKPVKKVTTIWVTEKGDVLKPRTDGEQPKENFDGYEFVRTDKDKDGNTTHIYRPVEKPVEKPVKKVTTIWVTEKGEVLKPKTEGELPKENFDGYEFVRTDKDKDGNTTHVYHKVEKPQRPTVETPKELPKTGDTSTSLALISVALLAAGLLVKPRKRRD